MDKDQIEMNDFDTAKKIKVLHFVECWLPQTMTWLYNQIKFLPHNVENYIVCISTKNTDQFPMEKIYSCETLSLWQRYIDKLKCKFRLSNSLKTHLPLLEHVIQTKRPDIIHSHFGHFGWINSPLAMKYHLSHIVHFYGADVNYIPLSNNSWLRRYQEMSDNIDLLLCEGPFMASSIAQLNIKQEKIKIYRLGIDLQKIKFDPRRYQKGDRIRFLIAGTFREKKGIPIALESLGMYSKINDNFEITIIGDAGQSQRDQLEKQKILQTINIWGLKDRIRFLGFQSHEALLSEAYQHHIFISPSVKAVDGDTEGGAPVTIIEMAASGMPVVSTTHCDIPYVLSEKNKPFLVKERDSQALCEAVNKLIRSDWQNLVLSNRQFIEQELDVQKQSEKLYQIYLSII